MKKVIIAAVLMASGSAMAAGYGSAGCGLGSMVFGSQRGMVQVLAATTNGTSGSQTFGISSGTSNCGNAGKTPTQFIEVNKAALNNEAARGEGETLSALGEIYDCKKGEAFGKDMKANYKEIFNTQDAQAINNKIKEAIDTKKVNC